MGDIKGAAHTTMAAKLIADAITAEYRPVKSSLLADMLANGVERLRVKNDDGTDFGTVILAAGEPKAQVVDVKAFTTWVAARHPSEIVQVVREVFAKKLLDEATAKGAPVDGEGEEIPGVELVAGDPYLTVRPTGDARSRMRDTLVKSGLLALPAGGAS